AGTGWYLVRIRAHVHGRRLRLARPPASPTANGERWRPIGRHRSTSPTRSLRRTPSQVSTCRQSRFYPGDAHSPASASAPAWLAGSTRSKLERCEASRMLLDAWRSKNVGPRRTSLLGGRKFQVRTVRLLPSVATTLAILALGTRAIAQVSAPDSYPVYPSTSSTSSSTFRPSTTSTSSSSRPPSTSTSLPSTSSSPYPSTS